MRIPSDMPVKGWTADAAYDNVPQGMSLDILNIIPNDQWQGRVRLCTRPGLTPIDMFSGSDGDDYVNDGAGEIQCIVPCSNYAAPQGTPTVKVRTDRILFVINGQLWHRISGGGIERVTTAGTTHFVTSGRVSGVQFKGYAYFCDGQNYKKVNLGNKTLSDSDIEDWLDDCEGLGIGPLGPCSVESPSTSDGTGDNKASLIVKFGARLAMAGVIGAEEVWFLSAIDDPDDWNPQTGSLTDSIAGGTNAADGYGTIGEPIEALIPFGQGGLLICGRRTISYLTSDPAFDGKILMMSRSLGLVSSGAWCPGPGQSAFVLTEEGLLFLQPNVFAVDKSHLVSRGRLDSFFGGLDWPDLHVQLVHDVSRSGVWIWLNNIAFPSSSKHVFYSYATDGFFPFAMAHPRFTGATVAVHSPLASGAGELGQSLPVLASAGGMVATFDPTIICGSDGHLSSFFGGVSSLFADGEPTALLPDTAEAQRIESQVSIGPLAPPEPTNVLIREVTVESSVDQYLPDTSIKGATNKPRVELIYGASPQTAIGADVSSVTVTRIDEIVLDGDSWTAGSGGDPETADVVLDGGVATASDTWETGDADGHASGTAWSDDAAIDGGYASRAWDTSRWTANDLFEAVGDRRYEPVTSNGMYMVREAWPESTDSVRWVVRAPVGTTHADGATATTKNPVIYVQQPIDGGFPVPLLGQDFHGAAPCYIDESGVEQCTTYSAGTVFGSHDDDVSLGTQWDAVTDPSYDQEVGGYYRADKFQTTEALMPDIHLLDLGCLTAGRGNRRRCRVRTAAAFIRVRGVTDGGANDFANHTSGHPFALAGITVLADAVGTRRTIETPVCEGTSTPDIIPEPPGGGGEVSVGACCVGSTCSTETEADCASLGGDWLGPLSEGMPSCDDAPCDIPVGACCYQDGVFPTDYTCKHYTQQFCNTLNKSTWYGSNTTCSSVTTCEVRRCCFGSDNCENPHPTYGNCADLTQADCEAAGGGTWGAPGETCNTVVCCIQDPPLLGACCSCGECTAGVAQSECVAIGGTFTANATCDEVSCTAPCVYSDPACADSCANKTETECAALSGTWHKGYCGCELGSCDTAAVCPSLQGLGYCCKISESEGVLECCEGLTEAECGADEPMNACVPNITDPADTDWEWTSFTEVACACEDAVPLSCTPIPYCANCNNCPPVTGNYTICSPPGYGFVTCLQDCEEGGGG